MAHSNRVNGVSRPASFLINFGFIVFCLACVLPVILVASISFTDESTIREYGYNFMPKLFSLEAYKFLFLSSSSVGRAFVLTIFVTITGTAINIFCLSLYAYPLSRDDFPFKKFFTVYILTTMLFSGGMVPSYMINTTILHINDTIFALILPILGGGFSIFVMKMYYKQNIPAAILESAKIDGAGEFRTYFTIAMPMAKPILAAMSFFSTVGIWNNWMTSLYYISKEELFTIQFVMQRALQAVQYMQQFLESNKGAGMERTIQLPEESVRMAMVVTGTAPILFIYPFFQKYFVKGLAVGAVKG